MLRDEAERLNNDIQNLLDATTISSQQVRPKLQWVEPVDIVNAAVEHRKRRLAGHPVTLDLDSNLPIVRADPAQVEQALVQILDNAAKYSNEGSAIRVSARPNGHARHKVQEIAPEMVLQTARAKDLDMGPDHRPCAVGP